MSPHGAPGAGTFGRLFPEVDLPQNDPKRMALGDPDADPATNTNAIRKLAKSMVAPDAIVEDNPDISAGFTYFGQFVDHDITFDASPNPGAVGTEDVKGMENLRTPRLDLDSLYGRGPDDQPYLYEWEHPDEAIRGTKLIVGGGRGDPALARLDLQRNAEGRAIVGDPRNDENQIVSQMHLLWLRFHNLMVDRFAETGLSGPALFAKAREHVVHHYQYVVLHDFLTKVTGMSVTEMKANRPLKERMPDDGTMPVEFSAAAYRFGHSMIRPDYRLRAGPNPTPILSENGDDLRGQRPLSSDHVLFWTTFFQPTKKTEFEPQGSIMIDHHLSAPLAHIPERGSLPELNLRRGVALRLPSGHEVAKRIPGAQVLDHDQLWDEVEGVGPADRALIEQACPLWFYILKEAWELGNGRHLGPVGAHIVAEVFLTILENDPASFEKAGFKPDLWPKTNGKWSMFLHQGYVHYNTSWDEFFEDNPEFL